MTKKIIKTISLALAVIMLFSVFTVAFAEGTVDNDTESTRFSVISNTGARISISGITANCSGHVNSQYSTSLKIVLTLQKSTSSGYTEVSSWTKTGTGIHLYLEKTKTINILSTYRLRASFTAGNETHVMYVYP